MGLWYVARVMFDTKDILISVIIPFYNLESYLSQCVESLLAQTHANIELLLIDDGSSDGSGAIADDFAEKDDRITVFHQPHQGLSEARNRGLDERQGNFVMFVDGDDFVEKTCLYHLLMCVVLMKKLFSYEYRN